MSTTSLPGPSGPGTAGKKQFLNGSLLQLIGVGESTRTRLARIGVNAIQDLLFHLPLRYQDRTRIVPIGTLRVGQEALIHGKIQAAEIQYGRRRSLLVRVSDGTGSIILRFFHFNAQQQAGFTRDKSIRCYGDVRFGRAALEMIHPEYQLLNDEHGNGVEKSLTPVYPTTDGVHQNRMRKLTGQALALLHKPDLIGSAKSPDAHTNPYLKEYIPAEILVKLGFPPLITAINYIHRPPPEAPLDVLAEGAHPAQQRLSFDELLAHHLSLRCLRQKRQRYKAPILSPADAASGQLLGSFLSSLCFQLTAAQQRVIDEISADIRVDRPMQRLVQGDVGSGKTVVAAAALIQAIAAGYQAAVMAPTELLVEQHYRNLESWFSPLGIEVVCLSGGLKGKVRLSVIEKLAQNKPLVAVGTHALFQKDIGFSNLGMIVVDEQHRFGVDQRMALLSKGRQSGYYPHQLIMTATPIPRTLAMTVYADLDGSVIDEMPPGRKPVVTVVVSSVRRDEVLNRVRESCSKGHQAYWVCTTIEESEVLQCQAAIDTADMLRLCLPELKIGLVHGRLKPREKEAMMASFHDGDIDLLVATTVIEVGVDVPNASLMVIENAERLGLSQLHQLRGRVGRDTKTSSCVLMYQGPLSEMARARLATMRETNDGFEIARRDLELRGPGEVLGTRQTGALKLRIADLVRDQKLLPKVAEVARTMQEKYPERIPPFVDRWLGGAQHYRDV